MSSRAPRSYPVRLYVYDLSRGMARAMSLALLGQQLDGIWHTAIVVYNREYFFGVEGLLQCPPGGTVLGEPLQNISLGDTQIAKAAFHAHLAEWEVPGAQFAPGTYDLFTHNCNSFSNEAALYLVGRGIPDWILNLPIAVLNTPLGQIIQQFSRAPMLTGRSRVERVSGDATASNSRDDEEATESDQ